MHAGLLFQDVMYDAVFPLLWSLKFLSGCHFDLDKTRIIR